MALCKSGDMFKIITEDLQKTLKIKFATNTFLTKEKSSHRV